MNAQSKLSSLDQLTFDNRFLDELPADPETRNFPRQVANAYYSRVMPAKVKQPQLVVYAREVAALLDLPTQVCESEDFAQVFAGNRLAQGMEPYATCYGGHQFGVWAGQLGDGRAINLGDVINQQGQRWALQLKGAGLTPYSRMADGLAALRSSIREFLCSEAMYHLGIPTTRAFSLVLTGDQIIRDMFYNGNPRAEPGAIVCRVAPTFIRFGHFQICTARGDIELLRKLANHTINTYFSHLGKPGHQYYLAWFEEICRKTAELMVEWERVGFVHGVMNTDNMSIMGLTIDYGPYGWLDHYDPDWTPNTTDAAEGRYRFGNQPAIAYWNLVQLANAIYPLIGDAEMLQEALGKYVEVYESQWRLMMNRKLGFSDFRSGQDEKLHDELLNLLRQVETDMTIFFRKLADVALELETSNNIDMERLVGCLTESYYQPVQIDGNYKFKLKTWLNRYRNRLQIEALASECRRERMNKANPKYLLRNYMVQQAIELAEQGDFSMIWELLELARRPYDEQPEMLKYSIKRPGWAKHKAGCSMLSCSS